jgi:hypothetical protein
VRHREHAQREHFRIQILSQVKNRSAYYCYYCNLCPVKFRVKENLNKIHGHWGEKIGGCWGSQPSEGGGRCAESCACPERTGALATDRWR